MRQSSVDETLVPVFRMSILIPILPGFQCQILAYSLCQIAKRLMTTGGDVVDTLQGDGVWHSGIKEKFSRCKEPVGSIKMEYMDGRITEPGNFYRPGAQGADAAPTAAAAFGKDKKDTALGKILFHTFNLFNHQCFISALAIGREITGIA